MILALLAALTLSGGPINAANDQALANASAEVLLSSEPVQLGIPLTLKAIVSYPAGAASVPGLDVSTSSAYSIIKSAVSPAPSVGGVSVADFDIQLIPLAVGKIEIPLKWALKTGEGEEEIQSRPLTLNVPPPALKADAQIGDIKGPISARPLLWPWLLALFAIAGGYWAYRSLERAAAAERISAPVDNRAPDVIAQEELRALAASGLWESKKYKEFYLCMGEISRRYLERVFEAPATKMTTVEILHHLRQAEIDRPLLLAFKEVFERGDLVKFAKLQPDDSWGHEDVESMALFIDKTKPKSQTPAETAR